MGKTVVKHEDVNKLRQALIDSQNVYLEMSEDEFQEIASEVFCVEKPKDIQEQEQSLEEMLETVTDENRQELIV